MKAVRNALIGAAAVVAPLALVATPAGAAQAHPKYIKIIEKTSPGLKQFKTTWLTKLGVDICADLNSGNSIEQEAEELVEVKNSPISAYQEGVVLAGAVVYICPAFRGQLNAFLKANGSSANV